VKQHRLTHGTLTIGPVRACGRGSYRRRDTYQSDREGARPETESIFAGSLTDDTPPARTYHADCECCWLGFSHTQQYHDLALTAKKTQETTR
jgi:hypothetical protein